MIKNASKDSGSGIDGRSIQILIMKFASREARNSFVEAIDPAECVLVLEFSLRLVYDRSNIHRILFFER